MNTSTNKCKRLPFRQIHLDFHTSGDIPGVGEKFDSEEFKRTLTDAAVDSITLFSLCHHGYSYHPTEIGVMHPTLKFDLLGAQLKAAKEAGIRTQIYLSAGANEVQACNHPEWREVNPPEVTPWSSTGLFVPGFHKLCFNTSYLDWFCSITKEALLRYPEADGLFFDIIIQRQCCCPKCQADMIRAGLDPECSKDRIRFSAQVLDHFYKVMDETIRSVRPDIDVDYNTGGHAAHPERLKYFNHLELESLPTGGWGYDHFPLTAGFARKTGMDFAGMTGKFHGSWGEFGGIKHPNALRYECGAMLAAGARCNVGDQLHPCGKLDETTYRVIGEAFREVREKEPYCRDAVNRAEIAFMSAANLGLSDESDLGLSRLLLEGHFLFDVLTKEMDFSGYPLTVFPEGFLPSPEMQKRIESYLAKGGKVLFAGTALDKLPFDGGAVFAGKNELKPAYFLPAKKFSPEWLTTPFVLYADGLRMKVTDGESLGDLFEPYFNRTLEHFCSHRQTPNRLTPSGYAAGSMKNGVVMLPFNLFSGYYANGDAATREFFEKLTDHLLGETRILRSNLPSVARGTVTTDAVNRRDIVHFCYAPIVCRGNNIQIIEDLLPLNNIRFQVRSSHPVKSVRLVPEGRILEFQEKDGTVSGVLDQFTCHAMIALEWK